MIKAIIFDADGMVVITEMFSVKYCEEYKVPYETILPFFKNEFQPCLVGQADLKEQIKPYLEKWGWTKSVDDFLNYWFKAEHHVDQRVIETISKLRKSEIRCYLATNQELYRTQYLRNQMGFDTVFDKVFSSAEIGYKKPQHEYFEVIVEDLGLSRDEVQFWDDQEKNVQLATEFGFDARLYTRFDEFEKVVGEYMLHKDLKEEWNKSSSKIPIDKDPSVYAIEKEQLFPKRSSVCDLGGGTGADALHFISKGHEVTLIDISDYALDVARQKAEKAGFGDRLRTVQMNLYEGGFPFPGNSFDVIYSRLALHYFPSKRLGELFGEILRMLRPQGKAFVSVKSPDDVEEMKFLKETAKEVENSVFDNNGQIKTRFSKERLGEILKQAGISKFTIDDYVESFEGRNDRVKSGKDNLLLLEIVITK